MLIPLFSLTFTSCGGDEPLEPYERTPNSAIDNETTNEDTVDPALLRKIKATSWRLTSSSIGLPIDKDLTLTFSDEKFQISKPNPGDWDSSINVNLCYKLYFNSKVQDIIPVGYWSVDNDYIYIGISPILVGFSVSASQKIGDYLSGLKGKYNIIRLNENYLDINYYSSDIDYYKEHEFERVGYQLGNGGGSSEGGGSSDTNYEKPDIGLESYNCYSNSIIAYYRIYNSDKAKVTSAKGYYGTSSASSAVNAYSIGTSRITIKFSNLKPNTVYYIKCSATGKGGTSTSEVTRLTTTY